MGTKKDLRHHQTILKELKKRGESAVTYEQGETMMMNIKAAGFHETSALNNDGVNDLFDTACRVTLELRKKRGKNENSCQCILL